MRQASQIRNVTKFSKAKEGKFSGLPSSVMFRYTNALRSGELVLGFSACELFGNRKVANETSRPGFIVMGVGVARHVVRAREPKSGINGKRESVLLRIYLIIG